MNKEELQNLLTEKEDYLEKVRAEINAVAGQIVLLKKLIADFDKKKEPKKE